MLSKSVCKKCLNERYAKFDGGWCDMDDNDWDECNTIDCPLEPVKVTDEPPIECKYKLEHTVLE